MRRTERGEGQRLHASSVARFPAGRHPRGYSISSRAAIQESWIDDVVDALRAAGCVFAEEEAELLRAEAPSAGDLSRMVAARVAGVPLEQVLGWAEFCRLRVRVAPGVFVPRRRTSYLVELAVPLLARGSVVLDLCCGSGAIGAALRARVAGLAVHASDLDPAAVACARENLGREHVFGGDLYGALPDALRHRVDVVAVNAPYVPSEAIGLMPPEARDYERLIALDGGVDGLDVQRRVVAGAPEWLAPGGVLLVETSRVQASATLVLFEAAGFVAGIERNDELDATMVVGRLA